MTTDLKFEIVKNLGILSTSNRGWNKELNLVSWSGREARMDLREWSPEHDRMGKGVTLTNEEVAELKKVLNGLDI
ncbi:MAG: PC4/YdbC family ssDNA-binding protein [Firmicutes bacterium]|nr:PC4/YdbC family ssDNA-binding protein [Bacillota bacterium]